MSCKGISQSFDIEDTYHFGGVDIMLVTAGHNLEAMATHLDPLAGGYNEAFDINNAGQVVGTTGDVFGGDWHATIWSGATPTDLNNFLSVSEVNAGWVLDGATDINDNELIVGNAHNTITGESHAYLLPSQSLPSPNQKPTRYLWQDSD
jgi:uncharacterized membrane protein